MPDPYAAERDAPASPLATPQTSPLARFYDPEWMEAEDRRLYAAWQYAIRNLSVLDRAYRFVAYERHHTFWVEVQAATSPAPSLPVPTQEGRSSAVIA